MSSKERINVIDLIKCRYYILPPTEEGDPIKNNNRQFIILAIPAKGNLFITFENPEFISGHIRLRGKGQGQYPYHYLEIIENVFGKVEKTIEVCSGSVRSTKESPCCTVDINPETNPDIVADGQTLERIPSNTFSRWRCDPPVSFLIYN